MRVLLFDGSLACLACDSLANNPHLPETRLRGWGATHGLLRIFASDA